MSRIDTPTNTKIVYLYVRRFEWRNDVGREENLGHPHNRRLYRGAYNKDTKTYRLVYEHPDGGWGGMFLPTLKSSGDTYSIDAVELTHKNIVQQDLSEEDLDNLTRWTAEGGNKKLWDSFWDTKNDREKKQPEPNLVSLPIMVRDVLQNSDPRMLHFVDSLKRMRNINPLLFDAFVELVDYLDTAPPDGDPLLDQMRLSKEHGTGVNLHEALKRLTRYTGTNRRENLDINDLHGAIGDILTEIIRRNYHE